MNSYPLRRLRSVAADHNPQINVILTWLVLISCEIRTKSPWIFVCVSFSFKFFTKRNIKFTDDGRVLLNEVKIRKLMHTSRNHATYRDKHSLEPRVVDELPVGVSGLADLEGVGLGQRGDVDDPVAAARGEEEARVGAVGAAAARRRGCPPLRHELSMRGNWNG